MLKQRLVSIVCLLLITVFLSPGVVFSQNEDAFDLAIIAIDSNPSDLVVGQETSFVVTFQNVGAQAVDNDVSIDLLIQVTNEETGQIIGNCDHPVNDALSGLAVNEVGTHDFGVECRIIFRSEEKHLVQAVFVNSGTEAEAAFSDGYLPLDGEAEDNSNNNGYKWSADVDPFESNLPDELGRLFAGLAMFFAIMAIMAVGTEVVIDSIKLALGMKSKVTSLEALERMEKLIPGQLATLGVDVASQKQFENLAQNMRSIVEPISETPDVIRKVKGGDFNAAFEHLEKLGVPENDIQAVKKRLEAITAHTQELFDETKNNVSGWITSITTALETIKRELRLNADQQKSIDEFRTELTNLANTIDLLTFPTDKGQLKKLGEQYEILRTLLMHELHTLSSQATADWLDKQRDELLQMSRLQMLASFDNFVKPQLDQLDALLDLNGGSLRSILGLEANLALSTRMLVEDRANILFAQADAESEQYIKSLDKLLQGVEARRYETQSPLRKLWRRLRAIETPYVGAAIFLLCTTVFLIAATHAISTAIGKSWNFWLPLVIGAGLPIILILILWLVGGGWNTDAKLLEKLELGWNKLRGNTETDPEQFQEPKKFEELAAASAKGGKDANPITLTAENAAQIVLLRTDQQHDEDESRQRWFRFISVFVGLGLAYSLQIDAAELLDTAVPGIENTLNSVLFISGEQLGNVIHWQWITPDRNLTAGILLTGFAAAAGSKFWHDRLGQLQAAKKSAETAAELASKARTVVTSIEQENSS